MAPSARLPWYPVYTGDWLAETRGWPLCARAVYFELINAQWDTGLLPPDAVRLRALVGATSREWRTAWPFVAPKFPITNGGRQNLTLESQRRKARELVERRRAAGLRGNAVRWGDRKPIANGSQGDRLGIASSSTTTEDQEVSTRKREGFEEVEEPRERRR